MDQDTPVSSSHIPWHPAFLQALQLELEQYTDVLEFRSECRLTAEPLEIDLVIVKKAPDVIIEKNIARIFNLNTADAGIILEESRKKKYAGVGAYLYALLSANTEIIEEVLEMAKGRKTLEEVLEKAGLIAKWEKRVEAKAKENTWQKAIELLKQGYTVEQLEQMRP